MQHPTVYIDGFPISDVYGFSWTPDNVDKTYICLTNSGLIPQRRLKLTPEWYPLNIIGYPNYSVSKDGRLLRNGGTNHNGTYGSSHHDSYRFSMINPITNERCRMFAHLVIANIFLPPVPISEQADSKLIHIDGNPKNNRVENLKWVNSKHEEANRMSVIPPKNEPVVNSAWFGHLNIVLAPPMEPKPVENRRNRYILRQINIDTGEIIHVWSSISEARKGLCLKDTDRSNISRAIRKGTTAVGFRWNYATEDLPGEEWKAVQKYPEDKPFSVSNMGRIKTHKGYITYGFRGQYGYNVYCVKSEKKSEPKRIDHLVYEAFHWKIPDSIFLLYHKDDNVTNDNFSNLDTELRFLFQSRATNEGPNQLGIFQDDGIRTYCDYIE